MRRILTLALTLMIFTALSAVAQVSVTTYHYDRKRTGWNPSESVLTPTAVASTAFGLLHTVGLDDQVDAQPLVVPGVMITAGSSPGLHDVVYVTTGSNRVYAIDSHTGAVLLSPKFGSAVPKPLQCPNNGPYVGITSTPVIDPVAKTMWIIAYTLDSTGFNYVVHALDLGSLTDKVTPRIVTASHPLSDGTTFQFRAKYQRQRPALMVNNGILYAGFGSFCDDAPSLSRGWLLGWWATSLNPLLANQLLVTQATTPNNYFLSAIWMSGYGLATDDARNVLFVTGNSDYDGTTYDGISNLQESVVKVSPDLTTVLDVFTPKNQANMDLLDNDFGSGGVMVLPDQPGTIPHLAVAAGKDGTMFLMNEDHLGGYSTLKNNVLGSYSIGPCWCGPSYFVGSDGIARVVSSGGRSIGIWKLQTSPSPALTKIAVSPTIGGGQDPGFFTTISSNGTANPVIWAMSRPPDTSTTYPVSLYAFSPQWLTGSTMAQLFHGEAGNWPNIKGNSNLVPVVANGEVFVASNKQLRIFGLKPGIMMSPRSIGFASQAVGTPSTPKTITVTNSGSTTFTIARLYEAGNFPIQTNNCGTSLAAGATCIVTVAFSPVGTGQQYGNLYIYDSLGNSQKVTLTGLGI